MMATSTLVPLVAAKALRFWEGELVSAAIAACERSAGVALVGMDGVVSCAPRELSRSGGSRP